MKQTPAISSTTFSQYNKQYLKDKKIMCFQVSLVPAKLPGFLLLNQIKWNIYSAYIKEFIPSLFLTLTTSLCSAVLSCFFFLASAILELLPDDKHGLFKFLLQMLSSLFFDVFLFLL